MGVGFNEDLAKIRRVGKHFLIACHAGIETKFTSGCASLADGITFKKKPVLQKETGFITLDVFHHSLSNRFGFDSLGVIWEHTIASLRAKIGAKDENAKAIFYFLERDPIPEILFEISGEPV